MSSMYFKIFREFLDLKLRILGNPICGNPAEEIKKLSLTVKEKEDLQVISNNLTKCSKKRNITFKMAKFSIAELIKGIELLGFNDYLNKNNLKILEKLDEKKEDSNSDDVFIIIEQIKNILHSKDEKFSTYKNYLDHPRISLTKSMLATSLDCE